MSRQLKVEFGDFQTPRGLASDVCAAVYRHGFRPRSVLEPTCGRGNFLRASIERFPDAAQFVGFEWNDHHVAAAKAEVTSMATKGNVTVRRGDFFQIDWNSEISKLAEPILIIGNPPWVTNSALACLESNNVPSKSNVDLLRGMDALTGKSNFDISEWMLRRNLESLSERVGMLAVLCKTAVARKVLSFCWSKDICVRSAEIRRIDAKTHFQASVDACLLMIETGRSGNNRDCDEFDSLTSRKPRRSMGVRHGTLIANVRSYDRWHHLSTSSSKGWRSGIKHDCSKIFELELCSEKYKNGNDEVVELEPDYVYPLLKGSDVASNRMPKRWVLVPHRSMRESPDGLKHVAPKTWQYLETHAHLLNARRSSIYQNRAPYSVFGVGDYSFASWKVAISGMYKKLSFMSISPVDGRPVILDDTSYFFACATREDRDLLVDLVNSDIAKEFWSARVFWDSKRPITASLLNALDLEMLAKELRRDGDAVQRIARTQWNGYRTSPNPQILLFSD